MKNSKETSLRHARVPNLVFSDKRLSSSEKLILAVLNLFYANTDGECFPSLNSISEKSSLARSTVAATLKRLSEIGVIERKQRKKENGRTNDTTLYKLADGYFFGSVAVVEKHGDRRKTVRSSYKDCSTVEPRVVCQSHSNLTNRTNPSTDIESDAPMSESFGLPPDFLEAVKDIFKDFLKIYPKPDCSRDVFSLFCSFFTEDEELNDQRVSNLFGKALHYAEQCKGRESRYVKDLRNWLRETDPDFGIEESVVEWKDVQDD